MNNWPTGGPVGHPAMARWMALFIEGARKNNAIVTPNSHKLKSAGTPKRIRRVKARKANKN